MITNKQYYEYLRVTDKYGSVWMEWENLDPSSYDYYKVVVASLAPSVMEKISKWVETQNISSFTDKQFYIYYGQMCGLDPNTCEDTWKTISPQSLADYHKANNVNSHHYKTVETWLKKQDTPVSAKAKKLRVLNK